jgi:streptogramin lyase
MPAGVRAREISWGADGALWVLPGADRVVLRRSASGPFDTVRVPVAVSRIAGGPDGTLWMLGAGGEVLALAPDGASRRHSPGSFATEISVGADGSVWVVSTVARSGGRVVRRLEGDEWFDLPAPAAATKVAGAPDGMAWTANSKGDVWRLHPLGGGNLAECQVDTGCAECRFSRPAQVVREISVGPEGSVWVLAVPAAGEAPALMWLADPLRREYRAVPTPGPAVRVTAAAA